MSPGVGLHDYEAEIVNKLSGMAIETTPSTLFAAVDNTNSEGQVVAGRSTLRSNREDPPRLIRRQLICCSLVILHIRRDLQQTWRGLIVRIGEALRAVWINSVIRVQIEGHGAGCPSTSHCARKDQNKS